MTLLNTNIDKIKENESSPQILKNFIEPDKIKDLLNLYQKLPLTVHNKKQNVKKKRWISGFGEDLENWYYEKLKQVLGSFRMDNLVSEDKKEILGLFQESYSPIGLHVDSGFDQNNFFYKQTIFECFR